MTQLPIEEFLRLEREYQFQDFANEFENENVKFEPNNFNLQGITQPPFNNMSSKTRSMKIISFYAEKGGVGKTSNLVSIAYMLSKTHRVLVYDCDSQRSSTAFMLGLRYFEDETNQNIINPLTNFIEGNKHHRQHHPYRTLYQQVENDSDKIKAAYAFPIKKNLWLVPGDRNTSKLDPLISTAEALGDPKFPFPIPNQKSGKPYHSILITAKNYKVDYVLLDLSPSNGVLNRCLVMCSHYLVIPSICDFHCAETMSIMRDTLKEWQKTMEIIRDVSNTEGRKSYFPIPKHNVKFLGFIINRIDSNNIGEIVNGIEDNSKGYRRVERCWLNRIQNGANTISELANQDSPLALGENAYKNANRTNKIGEVREFWRFKNIADIVHMPVPCLQPRHMIDYNAKGDIIALSQKLIYDFDKVIKFNRIFSEICNNIIQIINHDQNMIQ